MDYVLLKAWKEEKFSVNNLAWKKYFRKGLLHEYKVWGLRRFEETENYLIEDWMTNVQLLDCQLYNLYLIARLFPMEWRQVATLRNMETILV